MFMLIYNDDSNDSDDIEPPSWGSDDSEPLATEKTSNIRNKLIFSGILAIAFIVAGSLAYHNSTENFSPLIAQNEHVRKLNELEEKKDYIDLIKALYENTDPEYSKAILPWLKDREDSGFTPYLYATARHMLITDEPYQALLYYNAAGLAARVDAARCADRTSAGWVAFLENGFKGVLEYMNAHPESKLAAGKWALMKEQSMKDRSPPEWMCLNGEKPSEYVPYVAEELWQQERAEIRKAFEQFVKTEQPVSSVADTAPASGN